jgi:uncharacterized membrane protein
MQVSRIVSILLLFLGFACLLAGLYPRLVGGEFASGFFAPGITFILLGGAIRSRRRKEEEREGTDRGA